MDDAAFDLSALVTVRGVPMMRSSGTCVEAHREIFEQAERAEWSFEHHSSFLDYSAFLSSYR